MVGIARKIQPRLHRGCLALKLPRVSPSVHALHGAGELLNDRPNHAIVKGLLELHLFERSRSIRELREALADRIGLENWESDSAEDQDRRDDNEKNQNDGDRHKAELPSGDRTGVLDLDVDDLSHDECSENDSEH